MKRWFWIGLLIIILLGVLGYLYHKGLIHTSWQWLSIILVALAAPFKLISSLLTNPQKQIEKIRKQQQSRFQIEQQHRLSYDQVIAQKEQRIRELEAQVNSLEDQLDQLELQQQQAEKDVMSETDIDTLTDEFMQAYGDET